MLQSQGPLLLASNHPNSFLDAIILCTLFDGTVSSKQEVINKMNIFFDCYTLFSECKYAIADISYQLSDEQKGMGHAEGAVSYKAEMGNGEVVKFEGPFKLYMSNEYDSWGIFYFIFPGFAW